MPIHKPCLSFVFAAAAGLVAAAMAAHVSENRETLAAFAPSPPPGWVAENGAFLEVRGTLHQYATGKAGVFFRMLDEAQPLALTWVSNGENPLWELARQGGLPRDAAPEQGGVQTITFRLRIHRLHLATQSARLEVLQNGEWREVLVERNISVNGVWEWIAQGGVLATGATGPVEVLDTSVRVLRAGTMLLLK